MYYIMGLSISKNNEESPQSINWENLKTEDMSSTMPPLSQLSCDAEKLVSNLTVINNINYETSTIYLGYTRTTSNRYY